MNIQSANNTGGAIVLTSTSPVMAVVSSNGMNCCDKPQQGATLTTVKGDFIVFIKTSGHGCDGQQGVFTLDVYRTDFNILLGSSHFQFDSNGSLVLNPMPEGDNKDYRDTLTPNDVGYKWDVTLYTPPPLPAFQKKGPITLLDVWGEGRILDGSGMVTGFDWAYNLNKIGQTISNGPNKGQPIPNMIPVKEYENPSFPIDDNVVSAVTLMGAPITRKVSQEIQRVLNATTGVVILFDPSEKDRGLFEHYTTFIRLPFEILSWPYCQITFPVNRIFAYGYSASPNPAQLLHEDL